MFIQVDLFQYDRFAEEIVKEKTNQEKSKMAYLSKR